MSLTVDGVGRIEETGGAARLTIARTDAANSAESASLDLMENNATNLSFGDVASFGYRLEVDGSTNKFNIISGNQTATKKRFSIDRDTGDISFYEDTGTTAKLFWDASAESLTIGQSNNFSNALANDLQVGTTSGSHGITIVGQNTASANLFFADNNNNDRGKISYSHASDALSFTVASTERMRIDSSGRVGIGTSSPSQELHVVSSGESDIRLQGSGSANHLDIFHNASDFGLWGTGTQVFKLATNGTERMRIDSSGTVIVNNAGSGNGLLKINGATGSTEAVIFQRGGTEASRIGHGNSADLTFSTGSGVTERMRIDASGNLLVGKTVASLGTAGIVAYGAGLLRSTRSGDIALELNRTTSDGSIADFKKDGSTVGSIGSYSGSYLTVGNNTSGLAFLDAGSPHSIRPHNVSTNAPNDDSLDLGATGARFKNLYLSGGAYLGGTAAANKLDDYEEGTWTPAIIGSTSGSITGFTVNEATYTKIGDTVRLSCYLTSINMTTSTVVGTYRIIGLPFVGDPFSDVLNVTYCNMFSFDESTTSISGYCSGSVINLHKGSSIVSVTNSDTGTGTAAAIMLSIVYKV